MTCELHARSAFSFLEGASQPEAMVREAARLGYESIAITDRGGFYGSARAHQAAREVGIRALVGSTLELPDGACLPVLCATRDGYRSLSRHLTDRHLHGSKELPLGLNNGDLIALTGDREGPLCRPLLRDDRQGALQAAERLMAIFGPGNVFVELHRHGRRDEGRLNRDLVGLAEQLRLPVVASNAPLHATRGDRRLADAFACLRHHVPLDRAGRLLAPNGERHLKSPAEMAALFADLPQALTNTRRLAERLEFTLENLNYRFPDFPDGRGQPLSVVEVVRLDAASDPDRPTRPLLGGGVRLVPRRDGSLLVSAAPERSAAASRPTAASLSDLLERAGRLVPASRDYPVLDFGAIFGSRASDGLPLLGECSRPGLFAARGFGVDELELSPSAGAVLGALLSGERPPLDAAPFSPERFPRDIHPAGGGGRVIT